MLFRSDTADNKIITNDTQALGEFSQLNADQHPVDSGTLDNLHGPKFHEHRSGMGANKLNV